MSLVYLPSTSADIPGEASRAGCPRAPRRGNAVRHCSVNGRERRELKIRQQPVKLVRHGTQTGIRAQTRYPAAGKMWLLGIELPGVEIHAGRLPLLAIDQANPCRRVAVGQKS